MSKMNIWDNILDNYMHWEQITLDDEKNLLNNIYEFGEIYRKKIRTWHKIKILKTWQIKMQIKYVIGGNYDVSNG